MSPIDPAPYAPEDSLAPREPDAIEDTGLDPSFLHGLALKIA